MRYVLAVITEFNGVSSGKVVIKARGKMISKAVDIAEIVRNRFITSVKVEDVKIGSETVTNNEGIKKNISSIELYLKN
jgi:DNA-binding protein